MPVRIKDDGTVVVSYREDGKEKHKNFGAGDEAFLSAFEFDAFIMSKMDEEADHRPVICFDDLVSHYWF